VFSGRPALLVVLSEAPELAPPGPWNAIPERHLFLEGMPLSLSDGD
jgi:hypothetical protein